ncbi:MAG TPA: RIP metalloprotease RseP [Candidatus Deferrimicrobiaceae bacterium]
MTNLIPPGLTYALSFLVALGILIFVHEFGHFIVARKLGIGVTKFSFGFGPKLFGFTRGETEYLVSAIPFGGYVKMIGEGDGDDVPAEDRARSFHHKPVWVRMAVVAAGPAGNLLFAIVAFWLFFVLGAPVLTSRISVDPGGPAEKAGLRSGDLIVAVDNAPVSDFDGVDSAVSKKGPGKPLALSVRRDGTLLSFSVVTVPEDGRNPFGEKVKGVGIGVAPVSLPRIGSVLPGSPAAAAGLQNDDLVLRIDNVSIASWSVLSGMVHTGSPDRPMRFEVRRGKTEMTFNVTPRLEPGVDASGKKTMDPRVGISASPETILRKAGPLSAVALAFRRVWELIVLTVMVVVKLIARTVPARTLGGPILIAQMAGDQARLGLGQFANFLGLLSVNLGILNLLPVPVLDGGHLLFFSIEGIRRKPLSEKTRGIAQQVGLTLLLMLMVLVFYNDLARLDVFNAVGRFLMRMFHAG